jgi:hypothetical protein
MERHLNLAGATALVVGQVIAVGIFMTPAGMARLLASPFWLLVPSSMARSPRAIPTRGADMSTSAKRGGPGWRSCTDGSAAS